MQTQALFDNIPQHIIAELNEATDRIYIAVAWFTREDILEVLLDKAKAGITIQVALSNDRINHTTKIQHDILNQYPNANVYWVGDGKQDFLCD